MNTLKAMELAHAKMKEHGLDGKGWTFHFDKAKRRFGYCRYKLKTISLSRELTELNDEAKVLDTILHEIAHALAGPRAGHYRKWKYIASSIGATPTRCYGSDVVQPEHKWIGRCPAGHEVHRMKRMRLSCSRCHPRFSTDHLFEWIPNTATGVE